MEIADFCGVNGWRPDGQRPITHTVKDPLTGEPIEATQATGRLPKAICSRCDGSYAPYIGIERQTVDLISAVTGEVLPWTIELPRRGYCGPARARYDAAKKNGYHNTEQTIYQAPSSVETTQAGAISEKNKSRERSIRQRTDSLRRLVNMREGQPIGEKRAKKIAGLVNSLKPVIRGSFGDRPTDRDLLSTVNTAMAIIPAKTSKKWKSLHAWWASFPTEHQRDYLDNLLNGNHSNGEGGEPKIMDYSKKAVLERMKAVDNALVQARRQEKPSSFTRMEEWCKL